MNDKINIGWWFDITAGHEKAQGVGEQSAFGYQLSEGDGRPSPFSCGVLVFSISASSFSTGVKK